MRTAKVVNEKEAMDDLLTADEFADRPREGSLHNAHVFGRLRRRLRALALVDDLSPSQAAVLTRLHKEGPSSTSVLARAEAVSHQAISAILAVLDNRGFIHRSPDRRSTTTDLVDRCRGGAGRGHHRGTGGMAGPGTAGRTYRRRTPSSAACDGTSRPNTSRPNRRTRFGNN